MALASIVLTVGCKTFGPGLDLIVDRDKVRLLHGQGNSLRIIAAQLGLTKSTVHSIVAG